MPEEVEAHPLPEGRVSIYGEPPTMPDIDREVEGAPRERPRWWVLWWLIGQGGPNDGGP